MASLIDQARKSATASITQKGGTVTTKTKSGTTTKTTGSTNKNTGTPAKDTNNDGYITTYDATGVLGLDQLTEAAYPVTEAKDAGLTGTDTGYVDNGPNMTQSTFGYDALGSFYDQAMSQEDIAAINSLKQWYEYGKAIGDQSIMDEAHAQAEMTRILQAKGYQPEAGKTMTTGYGAPMQAGA